MLYTYMLFFFTLCSFALSFVMEGNPRAWERDDLINFDKSGDCVTDIGDISSAYARIDHSSLFFRVTFDDMYQRAGRIDRFLGQEIQMRLAISSDELKLIDRTFDIDKLLESNSDYSLVRSPEHNLLEIQIDWLHQIKKESLFFNVDIVLGGSVVDSFESDFRSQHRGGNAAFVHHGNQGMTYSEVFYGQEPLESSGFDEILEVHQSASVPGNFHLSGTLMPAAEWHNPEFNDWLESGVDEGYVSMLTSAMGQHIMPFVNNDMNNWSVAIETDMVEYRYGYTPTVAWVPERVWLSPGVYPEAGVIDWLGDNWEQHGVRAVILDDYIHCPGADNKKIHWMNNEMGINLRVIPIDNDFVGMMHYDADAAKNHINSTGQYGLTVYGTDWEVAAEMNEHHETSFLDNYESVIWYCQNNYPGINIWKLDSALDNPDFNGTSIDVQNGTYGLLGGVDGYGSANNSWYTNWAGTPSLSDFHSPQWNYGDVWNDAYYNLVNAPDNSLSQLAWYTMMINLHETGWHSEGEIAGWEHHYSSHIKNANVYTEASKWANGDYGATTACFFMDVDHDGGEELIIHNEKVFFVFEGIGGKANWVFYKDGFGNAYSVVGSDVAYYSETNGDYNESSNNHVAALSDVSPNQQDAIYDISIHQSQGDVVSATLTQYGVSKTIELETGRNYLDVTYNFYGQTGYIKSGWTPDLLDLMWSGKSHLQRVWGAYGSYCGQRNSSSGITGAIILGSGGGSFSGQFEGTMVVGDEVYGSGIFKMYLYAGHTSEPYNESLNQITELDELAAGLVDDIGPQLVSAIQVAPDVIHMYFSDNLNPESVSDPSSYSVNGDSDVGVESAAVIYGRKLAVNLDGDVDAESIEVSGLLDSSGNLIDPQFSAVTIDELMVTPHLVGDFNDWDPADHSYDLTLGDDGMWRATLNLDAGVYEYKVIESDEWNDNDWPGVNQVITLDTPSAVDFVANCGFYTGVRNYDEFVSHTSPVVVGNFFEEIESGSNWTPENLQGEMIQVDAWLYEYQVLIPEGDWEYKVVLNQNFDQDTFGNGGNFNLYSNGLDATSFFYDFRQNSTYYTTVDSGCALHGDINQDDELDILDIIIMVSFIIDSSQDISCADMNSDEIINVLDVVAAVALILEGAE